MGKFRNQVAELCKITAPYQNQASAQHRVKGRALFHDFWEGNLLFLPNNEPMGKREMAQFYFKLLRSSLWFLMAGHANGVTAKARQAADYMLSV